MKVKFNNCSKVVLFSTVAQRHKCSAKTCLCYKCKNDCKCKTTARINTVITENREQKSYQLMDQSVLSVCMYKGNNIFIGQEPVFLIGLDIKRTQYVKCNLKRLQFIKIIPKSPTSVKKKMLFKVLKTVYLLSKPVFN